MINIKKSKTVLLLSTAIAIMCLFCFPAAKAEAISISELQSMISLLRAQVLQLQQEVDELEATKSTTSGGETGTVTTESEEVEPESPTSPSGTGDDTETVTTESEEETITKPTVPSPVTVDIYLKSSSYTVTEGESFSVQVKLSKSSTETITVRYKTSNGTAIAGQDYTGVDKVLTFTPGQTLKAVKVNTIDDTIVESSENLYFTLSNPVNANLGSPYSATLNIQDNDGAVKVQIPVRESLLFETEGNTFKVKVKLTKIATEVVTVDYNTVNGTAIAGQDYVSVSDTLTFAPGETMKFVEVETLDDQISEFSELCYLRLSNPVNAELGFPTQATLTILDDDGSALKQRVSFEKFIDSMTEGNIFEVAVKLSKPSTETVSVDYQTSNGTAIAGQDYESTSGKLIFEPGEVRKVIEVETIDDEEVETSEFLSLKLSNPVNVKLGIPKSIILIIKDNESGPKVFFGSPAYFTAEGQTAAVRVRLSKPSMQTVTVTVHYASKDITAIAGQDYNSAAGVLTFEPGETMQIFDLETIDDSIAEPSESLELTLSNPVNASLWIPKKSIVTIWDNDSSTKVGFRWAVYSKLEGNTFNVEVKLSSPSTETITVDYQTIDGTAKAGSDYVSKSDTITFEPGDTMKSFSVATVEDDDPETIEYFKISLSNPVNAQLGVLKNSIMIIVDDDTTPTVYFKKSNYSKAEGGVAIITARLSRRSSQTITVDYEASDGTAAVGSDYLPANGTLTFTPLLLNNVFLVHTLDDNVVEGDETVNLTLSNPTNATLGNRDTATLTIEDQSGGGGESRQQQGSDQTEGESQEQGGQQNQ